MDQKVGLRFFGRTECQFLMGAVERVTGLEGHNLAPAHFAEVSAQLVWRIATGAEIIMYRLLDACDRAAKVNRAGCVVQVVHRRVGQIVSAKNLLGFREPSVRRMSLTTPL